MLRLENVRAGYGGTTVLRGVSMLVPPSSVVALLGPNGAGKTTLLRVASGLLRPTEGQVLLDGRDVSRLAPNQLVKQGVCHVPEGRGVFPSLSVRENLITGSYGVSTPNMKEQFERVYELFPRLKERQNQAAGSLSGGEQQMLAVSRALMSRPRLLLVDELSLGLAPVIAERLYSALRALCDEGLSVVMVEQFHLVAVGFSDKQYVMEKGRFVKVTEQQVNKGAKPATAAAGAPGGGSKS